MITRSHPTSAFDVAAGAIADLAVRKVEVEDAQPQPIDRFETAAGRVLEREVGFALLYAGGRSAPTIVVFAANGDMILLGAHGLEGMNMRVDLGRKELVPAGPVPAASRVVGATAKALP